MMCLVLDVGPPLYVTMSSKQGDGETSRAMAKVETRSRKVVDRLEKEGWINIGGGNHDRFVHESRPDMMIPVPRHRELSPGVARSIAKAADWI
jgi:predicted RNA binding protein YcfA (HicA-like mRNA interferase family)